MKKPALFLAICLAAIAGVIASIFFLTDSDLSLLGKQVGLDMKGEDILKEREEIPLGKKRYAHPAFGFSIIVSEEIESDTYREPGTTARTITFTMPDPKEGQFQIYIVPYKDDKITSSQIAKDTHGRAVGEPEDVLLNDDLHALTFLTEDPLLGTLREVWFLNEGYLYEVTASVDFDSWLLDIMQTWEFSN